MDTIGRLEAIEAIRRIKARYFRGVDTGDGALVRGMLAEDCVLDYRGCCTDPATGRDVLPQMNVVIEGRAAWMSDAMASAGIVSVHQGHDADIEITGDATARAVFAMTDRLFFPASAPFAVMTGYGHYHDTYARIGGAWLLRTTRITRLRVETA